MPNEAVNPSNTQAIAEQTLPYHLEDSKKSKYLSYRASGFSVMESVELSGCHHKSVLRWREADSEFRRLDTADIVELRKSLSSQFLDIEFTRNFRLVMQKDFIVLYKSVKGLELSDQDNDYLLKLRNHYTPQHLAMIKQLLAGGSIKEPFDFTKLTLTIRREKEEVEIKTES